MKTRDRLSGPTFKARTVSRPRRATEFSLGSLPDSNRPRAAANPAAIGRGQGALEYLMTYGWAILIIVVIGGALYSLGVFNPSTWTSAKRATGFASFQVKDWKLTPSGTAGATLVLGNRYGEGLTITAFHFNTTTSPIVGCTYGYPTQASVSLSENQEVSLVSDSCNATSLATGKGYTADVKIEFTSSGGISHTDTGVVTGKVE